MEVANLKVRVNAADNFIVKKYRVTPAEAMVYQRLHGGDDVVKDIEVIGTVRRDKGHERSRLMAKFLRNQATINGLFPGARAGDIPETFAELTLPYGYVDVRGGRMVEHAPTFHEDPDAPFEDDGTTPFGDEPEHVDTTLGATGGYASNGDDTVPGSPDGVPEPEPAVPSLPPDPEPEPTAPEPPAMSVASAAGVVRTPPKMKARAAPKPSRKAG